MPLLVTMLTTPPDALPNSAEIGVGEHLELAHGFLAERRAHGADRRVVVVEAIDGDVVRPRALAGERQARGARRALLRRSDRSTRRA